ncbi:hypothetical protein ACHAWF_009759 [Thalassiosira exigua]
MARGIVHSHHSSERRREAAPRGVRHKAAMINLRWHAAWAAAVLLATASSVGGFAGPSASASRTRARGGNARASSTSAAAPQRPPRTRWPLHVAGEADVDRASAEGGSDDDDDRDVEVDPPVDWSRVTDEWELDCYSRPVLVSDGGKTGGGGRGKKKLWELLVTDSSGTLRVRRALPSNKVNSREVRKAVEEIIDEAEVKPSVVRFFRGAMFNMINIALGEVDVVAKPSRCTFALAQWIEERNRDVYPKMKG